MERRDFLSHYGRNQGTRIGISRDREEPCDFPLPIVLPAEIGSGGTRCLFRVMGKN
ncbi:hypothetical protein BGZ60DRAFT_395900 [Tricladium varicosporioides]|nr:hypothetical protein BGZ60DRAFT_395900 [Hymenoscyphus varicosporioides]